MCCDSLNSNLIFRIFQDEQVNGWWDRGEYEFLCKLWELNHSLPDNKKIRVVLADYQVAYSKITSREDAQALEDRKWCVDVLKDFNYDEKASWDRLQEKYGKFRSLADVALINL